MRFAITLVLGLSLAGAAHAQFQPIKPIEPPKNPYALPAPAASAAPRPPRAPTTDNGEFKPFKPFRGVDTNTAPSGLYPELHKPKKAKKPAGSGF